jgi:hypothetical protein
VAVGTDSYRAELISTSKLKMQFALFSVNCPENLNLETVKNVLLSFYS